MPFLDRMVRRATGVEPLLRLRPRSRFEPEPPVAHPADIWPSRLARAAADVAPASPTHDQRPAAVPPAVTPPATAPQATVAEVAARQVAPVVVDDPPVVDPAPLVPAGTPRTAPPLATAIPAAPEPPPAGRIRRDAVPINPAGDLVTPVPIAETPTPTPAGIVAPEIPTAQPRSDPPAAPDLVDPEVIPLDAGQPPAPWPVTSRQPREQLDPEMLIRDHVVPVLIDRGMIAPAEPVTVGPRRRTSASPARRTHVIPGAASVRGGADSTEVHVHIDRVEVQRQVPPTPQPVAPSARRTPGADLDAYLARRKERR